MSNALMDISFHADTQRRAVDLSSYEFMREIINSLSVKYLEKIVDCYPQSDTSDGIEQAASLFLVLYSNPLPAVICLW